MAAPATIKPTPAAPPRPNRMTLASVTRGKVEAPYRLLIHGTDGVGKTTFGADAPDPIFLGTEDGTGHLDVARFPTPESWDDLKDAIATLTADAGGFKTLVLDSLDWAEPMLHAKLCREHNVSIVEDLGGGYGKWVGIVVDQWRSLLAQLERLQRTQGMHVILIAHSFIKQFANPEGLDYSRYVLKLADKSGALCREWVKGCYFAQYETFAEKDKQTKRVKGVSTGARLLYTQRTAAYDAKDRYGLPEALPLSWDEFEAAAKSGASEIAGLTSEIQRKAKLVGGETEAKVLELLRQHADDAVSLKKINTKLNAKLAEKAEREEA
jgi:hypothetical protein